MKDYNKSNASTKQECGQRIAQKNIETIARIENLAKADRTLSDKLSDVISDFCGNITFVYLHGIWFTVWIGFNTSAYFPESMRFDPFPFQFLTLVVSLEAIFLSTFILISQNRQAKIDDRRKQLDLQVDLLSEQENSQMLKMLEAIHNKLGIELEDSDLTELKAKTEPEILLEQIEKMQGA